MLALIFVFFSVKPPASAETVRELYAIRVVEGADIRPDGRIPRGKMGEVGVYQNLPEIWKRYSTMPPSAACSSLTLKEQTRVAKAYMDDIRKILKKQHRTDTPYEIALAWNSGPHKTDYFLPSQIDYATRVETIYFLHP